MTKRTTEPAALTCTWHPDRLSIGHTPDVDSGESHRVCIECLALTGKATIGDREDPDGQLFVISPGKPCRCGPGFCASDKGVGFYGFCNGSRKESAPNCEHCGAPHQSTAGCWLCFSKKDPQDSNAFWLNCLGAGIHGSEVFKIQAEKWSKEESCDLNKALAIAIDLKNQASK